MSSYVSGGGFEFSICSVGGNWTWKVVVSNIKKYGQTASITDINTPFGKLYDVNSPIPSEVITAMYESMVEFRSQLDPMLQLVSPTHFIFTVTEGDPIANVGDIIFTNAGAFGSFMNVSASPGASWLIVNPPSVLGIGKNVQGRTNVQVNPATLLSANTPYITSVNLQDNSNTPTAVTVPVTINVLPKPQITTSINTVNLTYDLTSQIPGGPVTVTVTNSGPLTSILNFTLAKIQNISPWLLISPTYGGPLNSGDSSPILFSVIPSGVPQIAGLYSETVKVVSSNASNSPVLITVNLTVTLLGCSLPIHPEESMIRIEDLRTSRSSIDDFFNPPTSKVAATQGRIRVASTADLVGFTRLADNKLVHISQQDFWKLGQDSEGFFIERLVDDSEGPVEG